MATGSRGYSMLVRSMKLLLPAGAVLLIVAIFFGGRDGGDSPLFTAAELAQLGAGLRLEAPRFAGMTERDEPFIVRAAWAEPDGVAATLVRLDTPRGEITLSDGTELTARAEEGLMRRAEERLTLTGGVVIETSDGYRVETEKLDLDLGAKTAESTGPVSGSGPVGELQAGSFRSLTDEISGEESQTASRLRFENGVRLLFFPDRAR